MEDKAKKKKEGALENLANEELIRILHQQLETKEALKKELTSVQESSANLVIWFLFILSTI